MHIHCVQYRSVKTVQAVLLTSGQYITGEKLFKCLKFVFETLVKFESTFNSRITVL